jgi:rhodanese-related sulfurtransferase
VSISPEVPQVDAAEGARLIEEGGWLLDVREDDEWTAGHSAHATHIRLSEVPDRLGEVPTGTTIVAVCRMGGRSQKAAEFLRQQGVDAVNLAGGMQAWAAAGLDVVTADGGPGAVI